MPAGADAPGSGAGEEEAVGAVVGGIADAAGPGAFARRLAKNKPLVVSGPDALVSLLVEELARGGVAAAVREQGPVKGAAALVLVLAGAQTDEDERLLHDATRSGLPVVAVVPATADAPTHVPYVLDENLVRVRAGAGFPVDEIARRLARALGEEATPLAARLPALREAVCEELIRKFSRQNAFLGVVVFVPGADLPILTPTRSGSCFGSPTPTASRSTRSGFPRCSAWSLRFGFRALARKAMAWCPSSAGR